jgi:predicted PurR-regulated permease PerM
MTTERRLGAWAPSLATLPFIVLAAATGLVLIWFGAPSLLLLFAGILVAALLDACTRGLGYILPAPRPWRFALIVFLFASAAALILGWSLARLPNQIRGLLAVMDAQLGIRTSCIFSPTRAGCSVTSISP